MPLGNMDERPDVIMVSPFLIGAIFGISVSWIKLRDLAFQ